MVMWLPWYQWGNHEEDGWIKQMYHNETKHSKIYIYIYILSDVLFRQIFEWSSLSLNIMLATYMLMYIYITVMYDTDVL